MDRILNEIREVLELAISGQLFEHERFTDTPNEFRRLNDIAFSGDGEPTSFQNFDEIMQLVADLKQKLAPPLTKMVLITNASMFHRPHVQRGLLILDENQGEIWAKLDAGTADYFRKIERTPIPFQRILDNILLAAQIRPLVIQSLFMIVDGVRPSDEEIQAFGQRLVDLEKAGGNLKLIQLYTVARTPAEAYVKALSEHQLNEIAEQLRTFTDTPMQVFC